jgi:hypothetical protein
MFYSESERIFRCFFSHSLARACFWRVGKAFAEIAIARGDSFEEIKANILSEMENMESFPLHKRQ